MPTLLLLGLLTFIVFGAVFTLLAVGVIFSNKCLRGSCGGPAVRDSNGEPIMCATCPNRTKHKKHLAKGAPQTTRAKTAEKAA